MNTKERVGGVKPEHKPMGKEAQKWKEVPRNRGSPAENFQ